MREVLQVEALNAGYGKITILREVAFHVDQGEILAIIGPNGAGKSTLLKTLSGLIAPSSGAITFENQPIGGLKPFAVTARGIAHVPEGGRLFANMSIHDNLLMGAFANRGVLRDGVLEEIYGLFPILRERQHQMAHTLSGGQKQMLAIGRGLASRPRFLMLDEPSLGLAPKLIDDIYERLHVLRARGLTVLLVEQNITYALELADRGYVLENGRIVMEGSGSDLASNTHIKKHYLGL